MDGNLAATYTLIHAFLTRQAHPKAAQALKKAAKDLVVLKDDISVDGPRLDEIVKEWKVLKAKTDSSSPSSSSGSDSESDSDADSDSSSSSGSSTSIPPDSKPIAKASSTSESSSPETESSSSSEGSSDADSDEEIVSEAGFREKKQIQSAKLKLKPKNANVSSDLASSETLSSGSKHDGDDSDSPDEAKIAKPKADGKKPKKVDSVEESSDEGSSDEESSDKESSDEESSDEESDDDDSTDEIGQKEAKKKVKTAEKKAVSEDSSDSQSDSDSEIAKPKQKKVVNPKPTSPSPENYSPEDGDEIKVTKKRRTSESGAAVPTATAIYSQRRDEVVTAPRDEQNVSGKTKDKFGRKTNTPFRRVDPDKVAMHVVQDNRYEVKAGPSNDYGQRAHQDLIVTRGAGFRKEKNKKKRGSYRGGEITMQSHSFKFTD